MLFSGSAVSFAGAKLHSPGRSGPNGKITVIFRGSSWWTATEVDEAAVVFGAHDEFGAVAGGSADALDQVFARPRGHGGRSGGAAPGRVGGEAGGDGKCGE